MGYAVVHMQKIKRGAVGGIQSHTNREHTPKTNPDVDPSKSHENYHVIYCDNFNRMIKQTYDTFCESNKAMRADAVAVCNFIITSDELTMKAMPPDTQRSFFEDSAKWFASRYGGETILNATVHMDETTPHLHIGIMPLHDGRWSAKTLFTPAELTAIQTEFVKDVGARYGLERGREGSTQNHLSELEFKAETAKREMEFAQSAAKVAADEAARAAQRVQTLNEKIEPLEKQKRVLQDEIEGLEGRIMSAKEVNALDGKKTITGGLKGISYEDYEALKRTAAKVDGAELRVRSAEERADKIMKQAEAEIAKTQADRPSLKMHLENAALQKENQRLQKVIDTVKDFLKEHAPKLYEALEKVLSPDRARGRAQEQDRGR